MAFFKLSILPVIITSLIVFLIKVNYLKGRRNKGIIFLDLTLLAMVYWAIWGDIYCTFHLKPHYPLMGPDLGYIVLGIAGLPLMTLIVFLMNRYCSPQFLLTAQGRAYSISAVLSIFFILGAPHQFNNMMYYTFMGGEQPIVITDSQKRMVKGSYILGSPDYFIA
jgi:hypothetical protein